LRNKRQFHIYPVYFDANRSRSQGRRIKKKAAIQNPTIDELAQVATILGLNFEVDLNARYPRFWWLRSGRLKVKKQEPYTKNKLLKKMASQLKKIRAKR